MLQKGMSFCFLIPRLKAHVVDLTMRSIVKCQVVIVKTSTCFCYTPLLAATAAKMPITESMARPLAFCTNLELSSLPQQALAIANRQEQAYISASIHYGAWSNASSFQSTNHKLQRFLTFIVAFPCAMQSLKKLGWNCTTQPGTGTQFESSIAR